jgi:hypothetical protein
MGRNTGPRYRHSLNQGSTRPYPNVTEGGARVTFDRASNRSLALETSLPTDSPHLAFLLLTAAALMLPRPDRRLRAALGLPAALLGAASLRLAGGYPAPRVFLAVSGALLLLGVVPVAIQAVRSLREDHSQRLLAAISLALAAAGLALIVRPVWAGGPVRTVLVAAGLILLGAVLRVAAGLVRAGDAVRWLDARLTPSHIMVLGTDLVTSSSWHFLYYTGLLAAIAAPYWTLTFAGAIVAVIAFEVIERQRGVVRRWPRSWLVVPAIIATWWFVATVAGPGNQTIAGLADAPFSPPAELILAGIAGIVALVLLSPWPLHGNSAHGLLGVAGAAIMLKVALQAAPLGITYWQPLAFLLAVIGGWAAVAAKRSDLFVIAVTFAALWAGAEAMIGAALLALLEPVAARLPGRVSSAVGAIALTGVAAPMLMAEVVFTLLLAGAATALLVSLAEVAPPR